MTKNVYVVTEYVKRMSLDTGGGHHQRRAKEKQAAAVNEKMNQTNLGKNLRKKN